MERSMEPGSEACKQLRKGACKQILLPAIIKSVGTQSSPCRAPGRWISSPTRKVVQGGAMAVSVKRWEPWGSKITSPESSWKQEFLVQHSSYPTNIQVSREKLFSPVIKGVSRTSFFSLHWKCSQNEMSSEPWELCLGSTSDASNSGSTLVPVSTTCPLSSHTTLYSLSYPRPTDPKVNNSWFFCWLSASPMIFVLYATVPFMPGPPCEPQHPHFSYDNNTTSLSVNRPRRRHSKFSVITIIITGATRQSDWAVWRLPRTLHTTSAH